MQDYARYRSWPQVFQVRQKKMARLENLVPDRVESEEERNTEVNLAQLESSLIWLR